jgi:long-subunit fatty acid transport protein
MIGISGVKGDAIIIPRQYKNASNLAYGMEYQYDDRTVLRAGFEPRNSGIPENKRDFLIPLGDFNLYSVGAGYQWNADTVIDVAVGYAKSDQFIRSSTSTNGNLLWNEVKQEDGSTEIELVFDNFVYNPSAGLDVRSVLEAWLFEISYQTVF